jgi:uncharacterized protein
VVERCISQSDQILAKHGLIRDNSGATRQLESITTKKHLFSVWLHVVNGGNFRCFYCYIPELKATVDPEVINKHSISPLTSELVIDRLLEFARENNYSSLHVKFAGGEPTLNLPAIVHFCETSIKQAADIQVSFGIISNGSFSCDEVIPILRRYSFSISLSVDGFRESHNQIRFEILDREKIGSWDTLDRNVERLQDAGLTPYFLYTVTKLNAESLIPFANWAHSRGIGFRLSPVRRPSAPTSSENNILIKNITELYTHLGVNMPTSLNFGRDARFAEWNLKKRKISSCGSCRNYVAVSEVGQIRPCQMSVSEGVSIGQHSIREALVIFQQADSTALIARPEHRRGACTRCEFFHVCTGGCPQHTSSVHGTVEHPSPWCQLYGTIMPVYIKAKAKHMWRQICALEQKNHFASASPK